MTLRKCLGPVLVLLLVAVLGCSSSDAAQYGLPANPSEIKPTWTPVLTPDGNDAYITDFCFDNEWVILTYARTYNSEGPLSVATQFRC